MGSPAYRAIQQTLRVVGEAAWIFAWSLVLGHWLEPEGEPALPLWLLLGLLLLSAVAASAAVRRPARGWIPLAAASLGVVASVGAGLLAASLATGPLDLATLGGTAVGSRAFVAGGLSLAAWWRGSRIGSNGPSLYEVGGQFRFGILAVAALLALVAIAGADAAPEAGRLVEPGLALVAAGLLGVPLARIAEVSGASRVDSPRLTPTGPWVGTLLAVVGGLLLLTLLLAGVLTVERAGAVLGFALSFLARAIWAVVMLVAVPASYLVEWLFNALRSAVSGKPVEPTLPQQPPLDQLLRDQQNSGGVPPELQILVNVVLVLGIVALVVLLLARVIVRRSGWEREPDGVEEIRESVFGWETIHELFVWVLRWLRRPRPTASAPSAGPAPVEPRSVREVYRDFLTLTARLGFPRATMETPLEYASRLQARRAAEARLAEETGGGGDSPPSVPDAEAERLDTITDSYVRARYGRPERAPTDAGPARRALESLRLLWLGRRR